MPGVPSFLSRRSRKGLPPPARAEHDDRVEAVVEAVEAPKAEAPKAEAEAEEKGPSLAMSRADLNALAESLGIESPDKMGNKQAVLDAIMAKRAEV